MGVVGVRIVQELNGTPCMPLEQCPPPKKEICTSKTFGRTINKLEDMEQAVATYVTRSAEKLRKQHSAASGLIVFMLTGKFRKGPEYSNAASIQMPVATDDTLELVRYALDGVRNIYRQGYEFYKAGVLLTGLVPAENVQQNLFDGMDRGRAKRLMKVVDRINGHMGSGTIRTAAEGIKKSWQTKFRHRSRRYTTRWDELAVAKA